MTPPADPARYKHHRFPGESIRHGVWLYDRFPLSYRDSFVASFPVRQFAVCSPAVSNGSS
jgi:hypothetical protein